MSLSPANTPDSAPQATQALPAAPAPGLPRRMWSICFAILAFEIGGFLVAFPWMDAWRLNHFPSFYPPLFDIWDDPYFRGAISGLGVIDIWIAVRQTARLLTKSKNS